MAERSIHDAIFAASTFRGEKLPEFGGLVFTIAHRRIDDYHRKKKIEADPLFYIDKDGELRVREKAVPDRTDEVVEREHKGSAFRRCFERLNAVHKRVVYLVRFEGLAHKETAEKINGQPGERPDDPMTEQNVSKIDSRFGKCLDKELEGRGAANDDD